MSATAAAAATGKLQPGNLPASGARILLLPGLDGTGKLLGPFVEQLGEQVQARIIAYPTDQAWGYEELIRLVQSELPDTPYFLLGESFSGPIAIEIAARRPPALEGLILCGTFAANPFPGLAWAKFLAPLLPIKSLPRWLRSVIMWGSGSPRRAPRSADRAIAGVQKRVVSRRVRALLEVDVSERLTAIGVPVLVLSGRGDRIVGKRATARLVAGLANASHAEIDGPHLLLQARSADCAARVRDFISSCRTAIGSMPADGGRGLPV